MPDSQLLSSTDRSISGFDESIDIIYRSSIQDTTKSKGGSYCSIDDMATSASALLPLSTHADSSNLTDHSLETDSVQMDKSSPIGKRVHTRSASSDLIPSEEGKDSENDAPSEESPVPSAPSTPRDIDNHSHNGNNNDEDDDNDDDDKNHNNKSDDGEMNLNSSLISSSPSRAESEVSQATIDEPASATDTASVATDSRPLSTTSGGRGRGRGRGRPRQPAVRTASTSTRGRRRQIKRRRLETTLENQEDNNGNDHDDNDVVEGDEVDEVDDGASHEHGGSSNANNKNNSHSHGEEGIEHPTVSPQGTQDGDSESEEDVRALKNDHRRNTERMNTIQETFADLKERIYTARLDDLEEEVRLVHLGKHSAIRDRVEEAQELCKERMALARRRHDYTAKSLIAEYEATCSLAHQRFSYAVAQLRLAMMTTIECQLQKLVLENQLIDDVTLTARAQQRQCSTSQKRQHEETTVSNQPQSSTLLSTPTKRSRDSSMVPTPTTTNNTTSAAMEAVGHPSPPSLHHQYGTRSRVADVGSA